MFKKILLSLLVIYTLFGFVILPFILKSKVIDAVAAQTNAKLLIEEARFNPFSFELEISGATLKDLNEKELASFGSLNINLEPHSLLKSALHIKSVTVQNPQFFIVYNKERRFNFSMLLKDKSVDENVSKENDKLPRVIVDSVRISGGKIDYQDFTNKNKFEFAIDEIDFKLSNIDTNDFNSSDATLRFNSALGDGGSVDFRSRVVGFEPFIVEGSLKFESTKLYTQWKYMQDKLGIEVADGRVSFAADYHVNIDDLNSTAIKNMNLTLNNLRIKPKKENSDILNLKSLSVSDVTVKPMLRDVHVKNISLSSLDAKVKRDADGEIDWVGYLKNKEEALTDKKAEKTEKKSAPWSVAVDNIALKKIGVNLEDGNVTPVVNSRLNELNIDIKNLTLLGEKPFSYNLNLTLNDKFKCSSNGSVKHKELEIKTNLECKEFDIMHYKPYIDQIAQKELKTYNLSLKSAIAGFDANVTLRDENSQINTLVSNANFTLDNFALNRKDSDEKLAGFRSFEVKGLGLNTKTKDVTVEKVALNDLDVGAKREKNKTINFSGLIEAKESNVTKISASDLQKDEVKKEPYRVKLKSFDINSAKVTFDDKGIEKETVTVIDEIDLKVKDIDSKENSTLKYALGMRVNNGGFVKSNGDIKHTPLEQKGKFELNKISLKEFTPYIQEAAFLKVSDGYLSLKSKTAYKKKDEKHDVVVNGSLKVEEFFLHDSRDESTIASFIKADVKSFNFKTLPSSLYIDEVLLDSFYVDAMIDENKNMNLTKLLKPNEQESKKTVQEKPQTQSPDDEKFSFKLLTLKVSKGSANFADYSLPIDFKTSIHDLNGAVYAISNNKGEVTYVDIDGEVDEYGSTELKGSLEGSNIKSFMDINFNFKNLDLNSLSGYSAKFAGYKIDKGKLFLDLKYQINNSELISKNSIVIKSIELGDEIEDENITKLPLGFAIALLEDKDGVIDIDLPIEGNVDKPDFKYGALVLKTLVNLIVKAVTSPFKFLGEMMGISGEELKSVEFESGEVAILPPQREKLDNIATILFKKPKLNLAVGGTFDKEVDLKALKSKKLKQKVLEISNQEHPTTKILEKIYAKAGGNVKALKNEVEKSVKENMFSVAYQKELLVKCVEVQSVSSDELKELADKRAKVIQDYLVVSKNIDAQRLLPREAKEVGSSQNNMVGAALEIEVK